MQTLLSRHEKGIGTLLALSEAFAGNDLKRKILSIAEGSAKRLPITGSPLNLLLARFIALAADQYFFHDENLSLLRLIRNTQTLGMDPSSA